MSVYASAPTVSGPSSDRIQFMRRIGLWTVGGLTLAALVGGVSMFTVAPALMSINPWAGLIVMLATWAVAHWVCRGMVYGSAKLAGFLLACIAEGLAFGFLLLTTAWRFGVAEATSIVAQALGLTAMTAVGMLAYVWFSKGQLRLVGAFISMAFVPMLVLMAIGVFFPIGGTLGLIISAAFVVVSAGGLLWKLNLVAQEYSEEQHIEGAYEITMALLVLLWNLLVLLNRLRR
jgi:modulator of FtsH protease